MDRVCYFSNNDLSLGANFELAKKRIDEYKSCIPTDLNSIIELWHIRKLFTEVVPSPEYSESFEKLKNATSDYIDVVVQYFKNLKPTIFIDEYKKLHRVYCKTVWEIINQCKCFHVIDDNTLKLIAENDIASLSYILYNSNIVDKYKQVIRELLLQGKLSAHLLLDEFVASNINPNVEHLYFPPCLNVNEREDIIVKYLDSETPNINYVSLICHAKDIPNKFILSAKTRYKAKKLAKRLADELMADSKTSIVPFQMEIAFSDDEDMERCSCSIENGYPQYIYSKKYILSCSNKARIAYFANVFHWLNKHLLLNLINKNSEVGGGERAMFECGRNAYPAYQMFYHKNTLALYQLAGYCKTLEKVGCSFEDELKIFYEQKLKEEFGYPSLSIQLPKSNEDWLVKCRIIFPELDNLARQYDTYVNEDEIDQEYMALLKPMKMTNAKSLLINKYLECNDKNDDVNRVLNCLFNSNSMLGYVEPFKDLHYNSLVDLMNHETVYYKNYEEHKKFYIDFLIEKNIIVVNSQGELRYKEKSEIEILNDIWEFGACSYWHLDDCGRMAADGLLEKEWLVTDDHLLSKAERKYFSFYTDNAEFTNGYAYRNYYAHGNTPPNEDVDAHSTAYLVMLRLLTILIIKIYDDLWIAKKALVIGIYHHNYNKNYYRLLKKLNV